MSIYVDDDEDYIPIVVNARGNRGGNRIYLSPPSSGHRPRAASQGAQAQPINLTVQAPQERNPLIHYHSHSHSGSHSRSRSRSRSRHSHRHSDDYNSDDSRYARRRSKERRRSRYDGDPLDDLPYHLRKQLDEAQRIKDADKEKKERRRSRFDADALDDLPYHLRKQLDEAQRIKDADKEKERAAAAEIEKQRWEADLKQRAKEEERKRNLILEEARQEEAKRKREQEDLRRKILREEEEEKKRKKDEEEAFKRRLLKEEEEEKKRKQDEEEAFRRRVLKEEEEKNEKAKKKKEEEEREFEAKVREKFKAAGYTDERIDRVLREKRKDRNDNDHAWAIDLSRPTFIKVNRKFLSPVTLDHFSLPWEWDKNDTEYIVIKRYIDEDFQDVLFDHTRTLKLKEKKLLTSAYEKDVTIKLRPATHVYKERDQLFVVRKKTSPPSRSTSRGRRVPWFFT